MPAGVVKLHIGDGGRSINEVTVVGGVIDIGQCAQFGQQGRGNIGPCLLAGNGQAVTCSGWVGGIKGMQHAVIAPSINHGLARGLGTTEIAVASVQILKIRRPHILRFGADDVPQRIGARAVQLARNSG